METIDPNNKTPFNKELIESGISEAHIGHEKLFELGQDSDKIVRVESFTNIKERFGETSDPVSVAGLGKKLYLDLQNDYGVNVPVDFVVGLDPKGEKVVYGITDKVSGADLSKADVTPELTLKVEALYLEIARYYLDKLGTAEPYLADINNASQYVYGKRKGDLKEDIYLIDTDLYIREGKVPLYNIVLWLAIHMISVERKHRKQFVSAREVLEKFLNELIPKDLTEENKSIIEKIILKTKNYLAGQRPVSNEEEVNPVFGY